MSAANPSLCSIIAIRLFLRRMVMLRLSSATSKLYAPTVHQNRLRIMLETSVCVPFRCQDGPNISGRTVGVPMAGFVGYQS